MARWIPSILVPSLAVALAPLARAQDGEAPAPAKPGFESVFAQDSLFFVGVDDVAALQKELAASAWGRLFADEKSEPVRAAFRGLLETLAADSKKEIGIDVIETAQLVIGRFGIAFAGSATAAGNAPPGTLQHELGDIHGGIAADAGEHAGELKDRVSKCFNRLVESEKAVMKLESTGDVDYVTVTPKDPEDKGRVSLAALGATLALGFAAGPSVANDDFPRFLAALAGEGKETLSQLPAFRASVAARPGGVKLWFDSGAMIRADMATKDEKDEGLAMQRMLGLNELGALASRFSVDAAEMRIEAHQVWGGGWLPKLLDAWFAGGDSSLLKVVPAEANAAILLHVDFPAGFDATEGLRKEMGAPPLFGEPEAADPADPAAASPEPAFDVKKELLDHFDGRLVLFMEKVDPTESFPMLQGQNANFGLVIGVKDAEVLRASIDKLLRSKGLYAGRKRSEFEGFEVFSLNMMPFMLHYAIVDDLLLASLSESMLQDALRHKSHAELPSLAADATFKRQLEAMSHPHALLVWSKTSSEMMTNVTDAAASEVTGAGGGIVPDGGGATDDSVEGKVYALLEALAKLDPAILLKHLPGGALVGVAVDQGGAWLEGVSR